MKYITIFDSPKLANQTEEYEKAGVVICQTDRAVWWLACYTQEEIAEAVDVPVGTIKRLLGDGDDSLVHFGKLANSNQAFATHASERCEKGVATSGTLGGNSRFVQELSVFKAVSASMKMT